VSAVHFLNRTLEQELNALLRGVSLECLVCGEFVMRRPRGEIWCSECGSELAAGAAAGSRLQLGSQAG
jgi:ribosomal protein L37AE/L43A